MKAGSASFDILHLLAQLLDRCLQLQPRRGQRHRGRLAAQRVGFAVEILHQKIEAPADIGCLAQQCVCSLDTRGPQPSMYRGRLWTMRQFAGFGSPEDTNQRFKYLLAHGTTGLSTAFDMPALMGYDADHPMSRAARSAKRASRSPPWRDFEILFDGIPLDQVTTSMTINASAIVALCMYIAVAEKQGVPHGEARAAPSRTTCSRSTSRRRSGSFRRGRRCASSST